MEEKEQKGKNCGKEINRGVPHIASTVMHARRNKEEQRMKRRKKKKTKKKRKKERKKKRQRLTAAVTACGGGVRHVVRRRCTGRRLRALSGGVSMRVYAASASSVSSACANLCGGGP